MCVATGTALAIAGIGAGITESAIGAHAASSAANQQKTAGTAAAQTFAPWSQEGLAAYQQAGKMFGLQPQVYSGVPNAAAAMGIGSTLPGYLASYLASRNSNVPGGPTAGPAAVPPPNTFQSGNMSALVPPPNTSAYGAS